MHARSCRTRLRAATIAFACLALYSTASFAAITPSQPSVTVTQGQTSSTIVLEVSYPVLPALPPSVTIVFTGLPPGVTTSPSPVIVPITFAGPPPTVALQFVTTASTPGGAYPITLTTTPDVGAGTGGLTLIVQAPTLDVSISPVPLTLSWGASAPVTVTTIAGGGFSSPVTYSFTGFPTGITTGISQTIGAPYPPASFTFSAAPRTPPGSYPGTLVATWTAGTPQTRTFPMTVIVQPPTVTAVFSPPTVTWTGGGPPAQSSLVLTPGAGYSGTPTLAWGALPAGFVVDPATLSSPPLPPTQTLPVTVTATGASPGVQNLSVRVTDTIAGIDTTAVLVVNVTPPWDAAISVVPSSLSIPAGGAGTVVVSATGLNGFTGTLAITAPSLPQITFSPPSFSLNAGASVSVAVRPAATATPGVLSGSFVATASGITGQRTASLTLNVTSQPPELTSASPPGLAAGTVGTVVRLTGRNFSTGAVVTFTPAGPVITSTVIRSPTLAEIVVTTPPETRSGTYRIDLRNPDGGATAQGLPVLVCPPNSLGAPLGVATAAIVFPRPFTAIASGDSVLPRGVLATTGVGSIVGTWRLDGIPFDQFVVAVSGGLPVEVEARMPIPLSSAGEHRLELVIEQPQRLTTEPVPVIMTVESNSHLRILAPDAAIVSGGRVPEIRWSIVPGASGYEVEIDPETGAWPIRIRTSTSRWKPDDQTVAAIGSGTHRYRVAAVFPGEVKGTPTPWRSLVVSLEPTAEGRLTPDPRGRTPAAGLTGRTRLVRFTLLQDELVQETAETETAGENQGRSSIWQVALLGSASETDEENHVWGDAARLQLTGQAEILDATFELKGTGDVSGRKDLDPEYDTASESRAWQVELGAIQSGAREDIRVGYSPPEFLDQSEFLSAGLARGGGLAKLTTAIGSFSYYDTFFDEAAGAASAYDLTQSIRGAGWEAPAEANLGLLRVFGLRARGSGEDAAESEAVGIFWRRAFSPALSLLVEGAWGRSESTRDETATEVDGYGLHLGIDGMSGTMSYAFHARSVDSGLANPANLGLTPGAVPDRLGADLMIGKSFGSKTISLSLRRLESGSLADGTGTDVTEDSGGLSFAMPVGTAASLTASSTLTTTRCDGDPGNFLPGTDRTMVVVGVSLSESIGGVALGQSLTWQDMQDDVNPAFDQTVTMAGLTFMGNVGASASFTAMLSGTRADSPPPVGTTDLWLATLQPTLRWAGPGISVTPMASFTRIDSELGGTSDTEQYQLIALWSPSWWNSFLNVQLAGDWSRSSIEGLPDEGFQRRIVASVILRWGASHSSATPVSGVDASRRVEELVRVAMAEPGARRP